MKIKRLVNNAEQKILEELRHTGEKNNFTVEPNQRIADVFEIQGSGISSEEFRFALQSHFDFVICQDYKPQFVVEFDGPHHLLPDQQRKDKIKDKLCQMADLPILRLDSQIIRNTAREYSISQWFAEIWFLAKEFDSLQETGQIPPDEPFMYQNIMGDIGGPMNFPYDIARPVLVFMQSLFREGKSASFGCKTIAYQKEDGIVCIAYFKVAESRVVKSRVEFRSFRFYPISPFELAEDLAIKNIEEKIVNYYNTQKGSLSLNEVKTEVERIETYCKTNDIYCLSSGVGL